MTKLFSNCRSFGSEDEEVELMRDSQEASHYSRLGMSNQKMWIQLTGLIDRQKVERSEESNGWCKSALRA